MELSSKGTLILKKEHCTFIRNKVVSLPLAKWNSHHPHAMDWWRTLDPSPHAVFCNTHFGINYFLFPTWCLSFLSKDLPPVPELDFGLWACVSQRSLRPRSLFRTGPRFFPTPWARDPFSRLVSCFPSQITWLPVPVTSLPVMWLPVEPPSFWSVFSVTRGKPTTNQRPHALDQSEARKFAIWAHSTTRVTSLEGKIECSFLF